MFQKHAGFPQRGNPARIQASLSSPSGRGAMPAQPFSRFSPSLRLLPASYSHLDNLSESKFGILNISPYSFKSCLLKLS